MFLIHQHSHFKQGGWRCVCAKNACIKCNPSSGLMHAVTRRIFTKVQAKHQLQLGACTDHLQVYLLDMFIQCQRLPT